MAPHTDSESALARDIVRHMNVDLSDKSRDLLSRERAAISDLLLVLGKVEGTDSELADLRTALQDLDGIFMLVVCGEYNAGKSTLLNALLGERVMPEGVTPTTDRVTVITHAEEQRDVMVSPDLLERYWPLDVLKDLAVVDTPGTNAIFRKHQELTERFMPRADLVMFVTSADRPFTESERAFLQLISEWHKRVAVVINKIDILREPAERERVLEFVADHATETLGVTPPVFAVAARAALEAKEAGDAAAVAASGLAELEQHVLSSLADDERFRLKLLSPLGVAQSIGARLEQQLDNRLELLADDRRTLEQIERQRVQFEKDIRRELDNYLARFNSVLLEVEKRGDHFLNETVHLRNVFGLMNSERIKEQFELRVIRGADREIDQAVQELVDWFLQRNLQLWEDVMDYVSDRVKAGEENVVGSVGGRFQYDRKNLLNNMRDRTETVMDTYNHNEEAMRLADSLQGAVLQTGLWSIGGVGLGAAVTAFVTSAAIDITGITAGALMVVLGATVLPRKRAKAKADLHAKMQELRDGLEVNLQEQVMRELQETTGKLSGTIAPYTRFVRSELERIDELRTELKSLRSRLHDLRVEIA